MNTTAAAGISAAAAPLKPVEADRGITRLISFNDACDLVGFKSRTSVYAEIANNPDFPQPITRGRNRYFVESEVLSYIGQLAAQRGNAKAA